MKPALLTALAASLTLAACAPAAEAPRTASAAPAARPSPVAPRPAPLSPAPQPNTGWMDAPLTPGAWRYQDFGAGEGKRALFSDPDEQFYFSLTCVTQPNGPEILFTRTGRPAKPNLAMTIRTETAQRTMMARQATPAIIAVAVAGSDPLLDAMALSKGRFAVEVEGELPLILPSWAEVSRVIEDCR